jgi:hypothetical protein
VTTRRDRKKLSKPLHHPKNECLPPRHRHFTLLSATGHKMALQAADVDVVDYHPQTNGNSLN